ncbi:MAG: hypothetical protein LBT90_02735 [Holosporaceae bacterium]|nr:hypothetical protein [Holosporaceae bacterium]
MKKNMFGVLASLCLCIVFGEANGIIRNLDGNSRVPAKYQADEYVEYINPLADSDVLATLNLTPAKYSNTGSAYQDAKNNILDIINNNELSMEQMATILSAFTFEPRTIMNALMRQLSERQDEVVAAFYSYIADLKLVKFSGSTEEEYAAWIAEHTKEYAAFKMVNFLLGSQYIISNSRIVSEYIDYFSYCFCIELSEEEIKQLWYIGCFTDFLASASRVPFLRAVDSFYVTHGIPNPNY